jgi:polyisoprenoid-binding protein YceI
LVCARHWQKVPDQGQLGFIVKFEGAEAAGEFEQFDVELRFDPDDLSDSSLLVEVSITSANMQNGEINEAIAAREWFDFARFPRARFISNKIVAGEDSEYVVEGTLLLKGVSRTVTLDFTWSQEGCCARMSGALTLSRVDFGIGSGEWQSDSSIGHSVDVHFQLELISSDS